MGILRKIKKMVISYDPESDTTEQMEANNEIHNLSDSDDSVESLHVEEIRNRACGCFQPPGGRCSECGAISCVRCHQHCGGTENPHPMGCGKPLCREHAFMLTLSMGRTVPFCRNCSEKVIRKQRWQSAKRLLFNCVIENDRSDE